MSSSDLTGRLTAGFQAVAAAVKTKVTKPAGTTNQLLAFDSSGNVVAASLSAIVADNGDGGGTLS